MVWDYVDKRREVLIEMCHLFFVARVCCWIAGDDSHYGATNEVSYDDSRFNFFNVRERFMD